MSLFEQILSTNLINFIIVVSTLVLIFKKARLGDLIDKMAQDVKNEVEKSSLNTQEALKHYKEVKRSMKDTPELQAEIIEKANKNAQIIKEKSEQKTLEQKEVFEQNADKTISQQQEKMKKLTTDEIFLACVDMAQDEVIKKIDDDMHKKLINSSIEEIDRIEGSLS